MTKFICAPLLFCAAACVSTKGPVERKMIGLIEKFDRWDYNGDGNLTKTELREAELIGSMPADEIIKFYDTDGNGMISLREAQAGMSRVDEAKDVAAEHE